MAAYLIVRAKVNEESREAFDEWYQSEHLPQALQVHHQNFKGTSAMRGWSDVEDNVHLAFYEFPTLAAANKMLGSELMQDFIKEFDKHWKGKVTRTREVFEVKQLLVVK